MYVRNSFMYVRNSFIYVVVVIVTNCIVVSLGYGAEEVCFLESEETQQVWWVGQRAARVEGTVGRCEGQVTGVGCSPAEIAIDCWPTPACACLFITLCVCHVIVHHKKDKVLLFVAKRSLPKHFVNHSQSEKQKCS